MTPNPPSPGRSPVPLIALDVAKAAEALSLPVDVVVQLAESNRFPRIPSFFVGNTRLFTVEALRGFAARMTEGEEELRKASRR